MDLEQTAAALAAEGRDAARLEPAIRAFEAVVRRRTPEAAADFALVHAFTALQSHGAAVLEGGDPQGIEDALLAAQPDSPITEGTFRLAWLALVDHLGRSGGAPAFGGTGSPESWAFTARSRSWPYVDPGDLVAGVAEHFASGTRLVVVRGPGGSAFLAALRRTLLSRAGTDVLVPPVIPAARDDLAPLLRPYVDRAELDDEMRAALPQLGYGEDLVGVLGRAGRHAPVALLLDDAQIQSRACLLGLPLFLEPSGGRDALLVVTAPDDPAEDGALAEVVADARSRDQLVDVVLPAYDATLAAAMAAELDEDVTADALLSAASGVAGADAWRCAHAATTAPTLDIDGLLPTHPGALEVLCVASLEGGGRFHGLSVGAALGHDEDWVEDLLYDEEHEIDEKVVGTCAQAVPDGEQVWSDLPDGVHPLFSFCDIRVPLALVSRLDDESRTRHARALRDSLLEAYGPAGAWQVADRLWHLDRLAGRDRGVGNFLLGQTNPARLDAAFRRMLPVLRSEKPYQLALARLYGAAMEVGTFATATGKVHAADQGFQAAAAAAQRLQRPGPAGEALARLGEVRVALALPEAAVQALDVAEQLLERAGHDRSLARVELLRAEARVLDGDVRDGVARLRAGIERLRTVGDRGHAALGLVRLGRLLYETGEVEAGVMALEEAIREAGATRDPRPAGAACMARAFVFAEQDDLDAAFKLLQTAAEAFQAARMPVHIVEVAAAGLQRRHGNPEEAEKRLRTVAETFKKAGATVQWADAWHEVGRCLVDREAFTDGGDVLLEAIEIRRRARDRFSLVRLYEDLATAREGQGDRAQALYELCRARQLADRLQLAGRLGRLDASIARAVGALDGTSGVDAEALMARAVADVDEMEALWKAPMQPAPEESGSVH